SHALSQNRLAAINFKAAAFTNLTGDHLDYHKTPEQYLKAKTALFTSLPIHAIAVLNAQSPEAETIAQQTNARVLWYAVDAPADITAHVESMTVTGTTYKLTFNGRTLTVKSKLTGLHNISNQLAAAGLCIAAGFELPSIAYGLSTITSVPGRLDAVKLGQPFTVLVDYAHTDDALKNVLKTLKPLCKSRLITVFGCGGDRDKTKRPRMAKVAQTYSDIIIVTSDNPRSEPPRQIIEDITAGFTKNNSDNITIEPDRKTAIQTAIKAAKNDDIILIAGKGHEDYQIIGDDKIHFDDKQIAAQAIKELIN
ncbi:MAG: UDP-N-acetylmuramoyl-L-alanyl-D-glutamate--2,6-diaminopimelate ligase, partial [Anaerohalosphaera sp.]|nr:UDP-N-acetylmuramoyl-L-alanyl-D-glutamate--2,6-diaminopimelate ligase [Anaerohalosphaera sp.]